MVYIYIYIYIYMYICIYKILCMCVYIYIYRERPKYINIYMSVDVCLHIYTVMYAQLYTGMLPASFNRTNHRNRVLAKQATEQETLNPHSWGCGARLGKRV